MLEKVRDIKVESSENQPKTLFQLLKNRLKPVEQVIVKKAEILDFPKERITDWTKPRPSKARGITWKVIEKGDITFGKAPKTQKSTLDAKKGVLDKQISEEMRIKEIQRENKEAIERFRKKMDDEPPP